MMPSAQSGNRATSIDALRVLMRRKDSAFAKLAMVDHVQQMIDEGASAERIASRIESSPSVALRVLKVASSCLYGGGEISSIMRAVQMLGMKELKTVLSTCAALNVAHDSEQCGPVNNEVLAKRMVLKGLLARRMAENTFCVDPSEAFLGAMLLDVGWLVIFRFLPSEAQRIWNTYKFARDIRLDEIQKNFLGFTYVDVGVVLAEEFRLSHVVTEMVRYQNDPSMCDGPDVLAVDIGHVATWLVDEMGVKLFAWQEPSQLDFGSVARLNTSEEALRKLVAATLTHSEELIRMMTS